MSATAPGSKVFAKTSKDWTIPPRPRPGRKAKVVPAPAVAAAASHEDDVPGTPGGAGGGGGRSVQNREAQRAFRERKQDYVAELEAKVKEYEKQEVQKNQTLQAVALGLKAENAALKGQLSGAFTKVERLEGMVAKLEKELRSSRSTTSTAVPEPATGRGKRKRSSGRSQDEDEDEGMAASDSDSSSSGISSSAPAPTFTSHQHPRRASSSSSSPQHQLQRQQPTLAPSSTFTSVSPSSVIPEGFDPCGFCELNDTCVCRMIIEANAAAVANGAADSSASSSVSTATSGIEPAPSTSSSSATPSFGAVSLRRKATSKAASSSSTPIWSLASSSSASSSRPVPVSSIPDSLPSCSGDPTNCPACADDTFGRAFCEELTTTAGDVSPTKSPSSAAAPVPREEAPAKGMHELKLSCCGFPDACGGSHHAHADSTAGGSCDSGRNELVLGQGATPSATSGGGRDRIPVADAWRQFKSHPNAAFADLSLLSSLAEIVSRGSSSSSASTSPPSPSDSTSTSKPTLPPFSTLAAAALAHEHSNPHAHSQAPPHKRRRLELEAERVREALRMLDARGLPSPGTPAAAAAAGTSGQGILGRARRLSDLRGTRIDEEQT